MIRNATLSAVFFLALLASRMPALAGGASSPPYELMRALAVLQDQIAIGNAIAQIGQVKMVARMAERFATVDPVVWKDKRNARALILYLFGGGNGAAIETAIDKDNIAKGYDVLFEGALAYSLGDDVKAREKLLPIDARNLPSSLGGHLALVQATLVAKEDRPKAIQLLDLARLLEPGTLVEEAALRKEMFLIGASGDLDKFALLSRRYQNGFGKSVYAENYRQLIVKTAIELGHVDTDEGVARMQKFLGGVEPRDRRRSLYLAVSRNAILNGNVMIAKLTGQVAGKLSDKADADEARSVVYFGAATIVGADYDIGVKALNSVDPARLNPRDAALRASALEVATMIRAQASLLDRTDGTSPDNPARAGIQTTLNDAERSLVASDLLIKRAQP